MKLRKLSCRSIAITLIVTLFPLFAFMPSAYGATINVNQPSQSEIVNYVHEHPYGDLAFDEYGRNLGTPQGFSYFSTPSLTAPYSAGLLADSQMIQVLNLLKTIRYIAGISDNVVLDDEYSKLAQAACIVNYANGVQGAEKLSHTPVRPDKISTELYNLGFKGSQRSNLVWGSLPNISLTYSLISGWMHDGESYNIATLGHRRWVLNPSMGATGFGGLSGSGGSYLSMYAVDLSNTNSNYSGVCWPAHNTPSSFFSTDQPWSISIGQELDADKISVTLTRLNDGRTWSFSSALAEGDFHVNNQSYGQIGCIIFRPYAISSYQPSDQFCVQIDGLDTPLEYTVTFFDLEHYYSLDAPVLQKPSLSEMNKPVISADPVSNAESYSIYRKVPNGTWKLLSENLEEPYFEDASAGKGLQYQYKMTSINKIGENSYESAYSNVVKITVPLSKPTFSSLKAAAKQTNTLKWTSVSKATGYKIYRRVTGKSSWTLIKTTNQLSYKDSKVSSKTKYEYKIRAYRTYNKHTVYSNYTTIKTVRTK